GLDMVAEGVESVHQLQVLSDLGCMKAQGFLISHPVPPDAMRSTVAALERLGHFPGLRPSTVSPGS
ncbi:MAG: EAL domain-containing protein, partial [Ilumatobacter sp.]|nr:EAL domain-containing protein [Ilumatobacter sp.]